MIAVKRLANVDGYTRAFAIVLAFFMAFQVVALLNVLDYFPDGFGTENFYHPIAVNLKNHNAYALGEYPDLEPSTFRPPLYPVVLSVVYRLFGEHEVNGLVLNNVLLAVMLVFVFCIGRRVHGAVGLGAAIILMLDPIYLAQANRNQSDLLFALLVSASIFYAVRLVQGPLRLGAVALAALAMALAMFTRAAGMYAFVALLVVMLIVYWGEARKSHIAIAAALVLAIQAVFAGPWMARNHAISGNADFAGMKGYHLASFMAPLYIAKRDGIDPSEAQRRLFEEFEADPAYKGLSAGERETYLASRGTRVVLENLPSVLLVLVDNVPQMFLGYAAEPLVAFLKRASFEEWNRFSEGQYGESFGADAWDVERRVRTVEFYWENGLFGILAYGVLNKLVNGFALLFGAAGVVLMLRDRRPAVRRTGLFLFVIVGYLTLVSLLVTQGRFRLPIMPGVAVFAVYAIRELWIKLLARRHPDVLKARQDVSG